MKQKNWGSIEQTIINLLERTNGKLVVLPETILPTIVEGRSFFNRLQTIANKQNQTIIFGSFIKKRAQCIQWIHSNFFTTSTTILFQRKTNAIWRIFTITLHLKTHHS